MSYKQLQYWEREFDMACAFAVLYNCMLSVDQFAASRHLDEEQRDLILAHLIKRGAA